MKVFVLVGISLNEVGYISFFRTIEDAQAEANRLTNFTWSQQITDELRFSDCHRLYHGFQKRAFTSLEIHEMELDQSN